MQTNPEPTVASAEANDSRTVSDEAVVCKELLGVVMRVEHSYVTIRTETGWLLWTAKSDEIRNEPGADFSAVMEQVLERLRQWRTDKHLWDTETPNDQAQTPRANDA